MMRNAWERQSRSLVDVQRRGTGLERAIREITGWNGGRVIYDHSHGYSLQVDAVNPSSRQPLILSVTYTDPDTRGHSNENKLQLKVGELALLKSAHPDLRMVLVIGGSEEAWLPYVLKAFGIFYDEVLFLWQQEGRERLREIGEHPETVRAKHLDFWRALRADFSTRAFLSPGTPVPCSSVRYEILDTLKAQQPPAAQPNLIENPVAKLCMQRSLDSGGAEWRNYQVEDWGTLEMSRNYFNPVESVVELTLREGNLDFQGGIGRDVEVHSLLHDLGMSQTRLSEDFVLHSEDLGQPVYIQCKASGGGRQQHGKNIQNRTKEQVARYILYTSSSPDGESLEWRQKSFHWISVLDGDWGVTRSQPQKYVHMLQLAGYDKLLCAQDLLTSDLGVRGDDNPLCRYLLDILDCRRSSQS